MPFLRSASTRNRDETEKAKSSSSSATVAAATASDTRPGLLSYRLPIVYRLEKRTDLPFLVGNMDSRVSEIVSNCQARGIDTLYVSVFRTTGPQNGSLWVTDTAGDWNPAWGSVRPSGAGIALQTWADTSAQAYRGDQ